MIFEVLKKYVTIENKGRGSRAVNLTVMLGARWWGHLKNKKDTFSCKTVACMREMSSLKVVNKYASIGNQGRGGRDVK